MPLIYTSPARQSWTGCARPRAIHRAAIRVFFLVVALVTSAAWAAPVNEAAPVHSGTAPEASDADTRLGRLSYDAGRGLQVGETGLRLGGFATVGAQILEEGERSGGVEELNFLVFFDPVPSLHLFTELGVGQLAEVRRGQRGVQSDPELVVERLYLDLRARDALNLRFGTFLTPVGRWNLAPREPLLWTTSEPIIVDQVFDQTATGAMLHGTAFPRGGALSYSLYGAFLDPLDPDPDAPPAEHSAGAHLEWASLGSWAVGASYFGSESRNGAWNHLGGTDLLWQPHRRVEVTGEAVFGEGSREDGTLWGLYAQVVVETVPTLYAVGRYERFDAPGAGSAVDLFDLGLAWVPSPYLRLKTDYAIADPRNEISSPGFRISVSILF